MKTAALALVGLLSSATASAHRHQKRHAELHERGASLSTGASNASDCGCTTYTTWFYGAPTLISASVPPASSAVSVAAVVPSSSSAAAVKPSSSAAAPVLPTPGVQTMPTPGTYTIPATTITVSQTTTVCGASSTALTSGTNTVGGVTTVVSTATTVVCPYATTEAKGSDVTSVIKTTTYVCPSAGTYTIGAITTSVSKSTGMVYPVPATFTPGTYTKPEQTVTVIETDYVYVCPFTSSGAIPPPSSAPAAPAAPAVTTSAAAAPPAVTVTSSVVPKVSSAPVVSAPVVSSAPASPVAQSSSAVASSSAKASSTAAAGNIVTNGNQWAMTYTPYSQSGNCKTASEVSADVALIKSKGFTTMRLYATDCDALTNVGGAAKSNGLKLILGIFIDGSGISKAQEQVTAIQTWGSNGNWGMVVMIVVGNEAVFNNYCTAEALAGFISSVKSTVSGAGFTGPVTTTEPLNVLQKSAGALCGVLDVVAANIQPFFNAAVTAESAGQFVSDSIDAIGKVCPGLEAYNLECGWPTQGSANGAAVPGTAEQQTALSGILAKAGTKSVIFSFENDLWKEEGEFGVEKYWGCAKNIAGS